MHRRKRCLAMKYESTRRPIWWRIAGGTFLVVLLVIGMTSALAQYRTSYPGAGAPAPRRTYSSIGVAGFNGNPYRTSRSAPTGLPVSGNVHSYYGGSRAGGAGAGGSFGYRPPAKPFSNMQKTQPLVTGNDVARWEILRGLW